MAKATALRFNLNLVPSFPSVPRPPACKALRVHAHAHAHQIYALNLFHYFLLANPGACAARLALSSRSSPQLLVAHLRCSLSLRPSPTLLIIIIINMLLQASNKGCQQWQIRLAAHSNGFSMYHKLPSGKGAGRPRGLIRLHWHQRRPLSPDTHRYMSSLDDWAWLPPFTPFWMQACIAPADSKCRWCDGAKATLRRHLANFRLGGHAAFWQTQLGCYLRTMVACASQHCIFSAV